MAIPMTGSAGEAYVYDGEGRDFAQFHLSDTGTITLVAWDGPEVPLHTLEWLVDRARRLKEGA